MMRNCRISVCSSEELYDDRVSIGDLFLKLRNGDTTAHGEPVTLRPYKWEYDPGIVRTDSTQAEYDRYIRDSELALLLFHTRCGKWTMHELYVALTQRARTGLPHIAVLVRGLAPGETRTPELRLLLDTIATLGAVDEEIQPVTYATRDELMVAVVRSLQSIGLELPIKRKPDAQGRTRLVVDGLGSETIATLF
ncbi:hypothetical protein [Bifidobacterium platyrrhinorum]|uniref:Uncharacterized protein n=1 Tax=Bifidobacterium platyrrhinorum TaxID=2661628 RepID=A0A6L9SR74_9BIFI|nr:hypothetical protein [Bifidobacterium platyrrhinorum]NEG55066.1 hypothetical protein [Bifidobacterium platyrrhinorum]